MACGCEGAKCKLEPGDERHGTANGYTNRGCRCGACREAQREYQKAHYEPRRVARLQPSDARHGTVNGYGNYRCRCDACREAQRQASREYRESKRDARLEPGDERHGTLNGYTKYHCRCDACREAQKAYYESKREAILEYTKVYYAVNHETIKERVRAWRISNPDVSHAKEARRRARKASAFIGPAFTRQQVWDRDGGTCYLCNQPADPSDWHMDHVIPLARGGAHSFDGCAVSHPLCNLRKGTRLLDELDTACIMDAVSN